MWVLWVDSEAGTSRTVHYKDMTIECMRQIVYVFRAYSETTRSAVIYDDTMVVLERFYDPTTPCAWTKSGHTPDTDNKRVDDFIFTAAVGTSGAACPCATAALG
jgi:hypothetical protein